MNKLLLGLTLLLSFPSFASIDGTYDGILTQAVGVNSAKGESCSVNISTNEDGTIDVSVKAKDQTFSEKSLEQSFSGSNEFEPKYRINRNRARSKADTIVVLVSYEDNDKINSVNAYEVNHSSFGYSYKLSCEVL